MERPKAKAALTRLASLGRRAEHVTHVDRMPGWLQIVLLVAAGLVLLGVAFDVGTASPVLCRSCHEMELRASSWESSAHAQVRCVECHQSPTEWYELPERVADRGVMLVHDIRTHFSGDFDGEPIDALPAHAEAITDEVCLSCHDPNRKATSGFRILIDHAEHAKRNGSCASCHVRTAHPEETRGTPLTLMSQCYTCHGTAQHPDASDACDTCHPAGYDLVPESHANSRWARGHGETALDDAVLCTMCHTQSECRACHGIEMPHPPRWAEGALGHAESAREDTTVCEQCHEGGSDLCTMCHHTSYEPMKGAWVAQHAAEVDDEGQEYCLRCHEQRYCSYCHTRLVEDGVVQ